MSLQIKNLTINRSNQPFIGPFELQVEEGEILTIMGPSGCGKSTLLNAIAGHLSSDFSVVGEITLNSTVLQKSINPSISPAPQGKKHKPINLAAHQRGVGILFQDDLLFSHLNIWENLALALPKEVKNRQQRCHEALESIGLINLAGVHPEQVSGGQRARISVIRALLAKPSALLLDEPFSKLDKALRSSFREFVYQQVRRANIPVILVTHDEDDIPANGPIFEWSF